MVGPRIGPRVEQLLQQVSLRVVSRHIARLVDIARQARQREVVESGLPVVFLCTDVVELKRSTVEPLRHLAVFTAALRLIPDSLAKIRHWLCRRATAQG